MASVEIEQATAHVEWCLTHTSLCSSDLHIHKTQEEASCYSVNSLSYNYESLLTCFGDAKALQTVGHALPLHLYGMDRETEIVMHML